MLKIQIFSSIFDVITVTFRRKNVLLSRHFRKVRRQIPQCFVYLFLPREEVELHSWHNWNSFIFCWFHQNHPHGKCETYHNYRTNDEIPYPIGEKLLTPILFTGINTEQAHDIGFPSLEATSLNAEFAAILVLSWQQVGGSPPRARKCWSSRIWWTSVAIFPRPWYVGRTGWAQPVLAGSLRLNDLRISDRSQKIHFLRLARRKQHQRTLFNWGEANSQQAKEGGSFEECNAAKPQGRTVS